MNELDGSDRELIEAARATIRKNYDGEDHTVGAAVRCSSGKIYTGINVYSVHGACAEQVAVGAAMTDGERKFTSIVAVRGAGGEEVIPPCGSCRQMLCDYMPDCGVIVISEHGPEKIAAKELLPFAYRSEA